MKGITSLIKIFIVILIVAILLILSLKIVLGSGYDAFVISNISSYPIFSTSNAGVNFTAVESGNKYVTFNISLKVLRGADSGATNVRNVTKINITLPSGFTFSPDFSNITSNVSSNNASNVVFSNETFGNGLTNLTWRNFTEIPADGSRSALINTSGTGYFSFRASVPSGYTSPTNSTIIVRITAIDADSGTLTFNVADLTVYLNDTILPNNINFISPTPSNLTTIRNNTINLMASYNETNPSMALFQIGYPNGSLINITGSIQGGKENTNATITLNSLLGGVYNITFYANDSANNMNSSAFQQFTLLKTIPNNLRYISPTLLNNTNISNSTLTVAFAFNTTNPQAALLQVGYPNGTIFNTTNTSYIAPPVGFAGINETSNTSFVLTGLGSGDYNFSIFANDTSGGYGGNTSVYKITVDTFLPTAMRFIAPTRLNNSNTTNSTADFAVAFNETNPDFANLSVGFPNGSTYNYSLTITGTGTSAVGRTSIGGFPEGVSNFTIFTQDKAGNQATNSTASISTVDTVTPLWFYDEAVTPANFANRSVNWANVSVFINSDVTGLDQCLIQWANRTISNVSMAKTNKTYCTVNVTSQSDSNPWRGEYWNFTVFVNDTAGNANSTQVVRKLTMDTASPTISSVNATNTTYEGGMSLLIQFNVTDDNPVDTPTLRCTGIAEGPAYIAGGGWMAGLNGTYISSGNNTQCTLNITAVNLTDVGKFTVEPRSYDNNNREVKGTNMTNLTYVQTASAGWSLIQTQTAATLQGIGNLSGQINQVSYWSNQYKNYTTWVKATSTNAGFAVPDGHPVYIYTNSSVGLIRVWNASRTGVENAHNVTLYTGWNQLAFFNNSGNTFRNITDMINGAGLYNGSYPVNEVQSVQALSYYNTSTTLYVPYRINFTYNNLVKVPKGYGIWININGTLSTNSSYTYIGRSATE